MKLKLTSYEDTMLKKICQMFSYMLMKDIDESKRKDYEILIEKILNQ